MRRLLLLFLLLLPVCSMAEDEEIFFEDVIIFNPQEAISVAPVGEPTTVPQDSTVQSEARAEFIDRIFEKGHELYIAADGKAQSAWFKGDIYLCKNFTTHIFNELRDDYCMAEFPDVRLRIPNNQENSYPYSYGVEWEEISAAKGNPFYIAASFRYDKSLSYEENLELACEFMRQVQRGDFFQMSADYEYGMGAHSAIMMAYDPNNDEIHWMDSNMRGYKNNEGIRYGICQYDEVRSVQWWAEAFCHTRRGATLYRLRDDIAFRNEAD